MQNNLDYYFALVVGIILFGSGVYFNFRECSKLSHWIRCKGIVLEMVSDTPATKIGDDNQKYCAFAPRIQFQSEDGQIIVFQDAMFSCPARVKVGDTVGVIYDPCYPENAMEDKWERRHLKSFVFLGGGVLCFIFYGFKYCQVSA